MADVLTTTGTGNDPVSTRRDPNESIEDWTNRHKAAITAAGVGSAPLVTTWNEGNCSVTTTRGNESDPVFINKHILDIINEMDECPPS